MLALWYLPPTDGPRNLWIDALCINQDDTEEREYQITVMGDIYRNATGTIIRLGTADEKTELAFKVLDDMARRIPQNIHQLSDVSAIRSILQAMEKPSESDLENLLPIFRRPWFGRLWVYQEVRLSVRCVFQVGRFHCNWKHVELIAVHFLETGLDIAKFTEFAIFLPPLDFECALQYGTVPEVERISSANARTISIRPKGQSLRPPRADQFFSFLTAHIGNVSNYMAKL